MKAIARFFLKAKHWQIFVLLFIVPTVAEIATIPTTIHSWHDLGREDLIFLAVNVLYFLSFLAWFGSMGLFFRSSVRPELRMESRFFYFSLIYPVFYAPLFFVGFPNWVIVPLHLTCMVCLFYLLYFVSKNLALLKTGKPVSFDDYAGTFFLLWFFPVGVWIIQPRVNRLFAGKVE